MPRLLTSPHPPAVPSLLGSSTRVPQSLVLLLLPLSGHLIENHLFIDKSYISSVSPPVIPDTQIQLPPGLVPACLSISEVLPARPPSQKRAHAIQMPKPQTLESPFHMFSLSYMSKPSALPPEPYGNFCSLPPQLLHLCPACCHSANSVNSSRAPSFLLGPLGLSSTGKLEESFLNVKLPKCLVGTARLTTLFSPLLCVFIFT